MSTVVGNVLVYWTVSGAATTLTFSTGSPTSYVNTDAVPEVLVSVLAILCQLSRARRVYDETPSSAAGPVLRRNRDETAAPSD